MPPETIPIRPLRSLRLRAMLLFLGLAALVGVLISAVAAVTTQNQSQAAQEISSDALRQQAQDYLLQLTSGSARQNDLYLDRIRLDAGQVAAFAAQVFDEPDRYSASYWPAVEHMYIGENGQYLNGESDTSSVFVPITQVYEGQVLRDIELSAYLDSLFVAIKDSNPNIEAVYFATEADMTRYYPNVGLGLLVPPDFRATQRPWYVGSTFANNPSHQPWWTAAYLDATGLGLVTTAAAPVYSRFGQLVGVVGFDVTLDELKSSVESAVILQNGYSFLMDNSARSIALPEQGFQDVMGRAPAEGETSVILTESDEAFRGVIEAMLAGERGVVTLTTAGRELYVAYAPLENTGWSMASVVASDEVLQAMGALQQSLQVEAQNLLFTRIIPLATLILIVAGVVGALVTGRLVAPLQRLASIAQQLGAGQWDAPIPLSGLDEIDALGRALSRMTSQLRQMVGELEKRVSQRTADLERRTAQLSATAQVAREAAAIRDFKQLLAHTAQLISGQFNFYHTGIFLLDDAGEYAVLQAASSEGGQRMLQRGHRLAVGEMGIVGYVAKRGESRVALDVGADAVYFRNPDLPETRSELALPLKIRGAVIGVLDVQSTAASAFGEEDIEILQVLADQISLAIENTRLIEGSQQALRELNALYSQQINQAWSARLAERPMAFRYTRMGVESAPAQPSGFDAPQGAAIQSSPDGELLRVPLNVRGQPLGAIHLRRQSGENPWNDEDLALAQEAATQIAASLENARLLDELQKRSQEERMISDLSAKVQGAHNLETVMRTAVRELGAAMGAARVQIRLSSGERSYESALSLSQEDTD